MKTSPQIRVANLELLVEEAGTLEAVAAKAETSSVYLSQVRNRTPDASTGRPRELGTPMARRLETAFNKESGWMDQDHSALESGAEIIAAALWRLDKDARRETLSFLRYKLEKTVTVHPLREDISKLDQAIERLIKSDGD